MEKVQGNELFEGHRTGRIGIAQFWAPELHCCLAHDIGLPPPLKIAALADHYPPRYQRSKPYRQRAGLDESHQMASASIHDGHAPLSP